MEGKRDMSHECGLKYEKMWILANKSEKPEEIKRGNDYLSKYCDKCMYLHTICMKGEE